jgi:5-methylcytosine-specific restriction endonuclease McrA
MQTTLLLDTHYQPLGIIDWQKAITLIVQEKAEVVREGLTSARTVDRIFNIPKVLRLLRRSYQKYQPSFSKISIFLRDKGSCAFCGDRLSHKTFTIDHVIPTSRGGSNAWLNVVTACKGCNGKKGARTPSEAKMTLLYQPRVPLRTELIQQSIEESVFKDWFTPQDN